MPELRFRTSRSRGKGGQNVNKVNSRVELFFNIPESTLLQNEEKEILHEKLGPRISSEGNLRLYSTTSRSQPENKNIVIERFYRLVENCLAPKKKRIETKPGKGANEKRIREKKLKSLKKQQRIDPEFD